MNHRPKTSGYAPKAGGGASFQRNLMSSSLPKLPNRYSSPSTNDNLNNTTGARGRGLLGSPAPGAPVSAWGEDTRSLSPGKGDSRRSSAHYGTAGGSSSVPQIDIPGETTISVGLMRIADKLARLVLPWQAVLCPRAVETLFDLRKNIIQSRHSAFIEQMKRKLEEKVLGFIKKKEEEVSKTTYSRICLPVLICKSGTRQYHHRPVAGRR